MTFLDRLNALSKVLLGAGIVDLWKQASQSKVEAQKAERLAYDKHLREAARIAEKTLASWSSQPGFWERLIRRWLLGDRLDKLKQQLEQWRLRLAEAKKLATSAKALREKDTGDPLETQVLSEALALYERCAEIVHEEKVLGAIGKCQRELQRRQQFQGLGTEAQAQAEKRFFKRAIAAYREAEQLYPTDAVKAAIARCVAQVKYEVTYEATLQRAQEASEAGRLRGAIALLESALTNFPRSDGVKLLEQLQRTVKGREKFRQGLSAEQLGALRGAAAMYEEAKVLLSDPTGCQIRLGLVASKLKDWAIALSHLEGVHGEQAAYLRGFAHAQQGNLQQAHREWQFLSHTEIESQREILKSLSQRQRLLSIQNIEQLVKDENLEKAKAASTAFIKKFGFEPLIQENLDEHIQPRLENAVWQGADWRIITDTVERVWIEQPNYISLHNWAVAIYYYALIKPVETRDFTSLQNLIIALSTALANFRHDPALQDVPWLGNTPVDYDSVSLDLWRRIEEAIDTVKDRDINEYLQLRDRYRLEVVALRLMGDPPTQGMRVRQVFVPPGCYECYHSQWQDTCVEAIIHSQDILRSLYTDWGLAVAACVEGNTQRAMQLKPSTNPAVEAEFFGKKFVAYHEGCYQLQHQQWREAMTPLKLAQAEIKASTDWQKEVDKLCGVQRQVISEFREHLEFAQFWYDLLGSQPARSYLAEYKAEQIRDKLAKEQISFIQALQELQEVKRIDAQNPVVLDLIERVEFSKEIKEIHELMQRERFEEAVRSAKYSKHERIRFTVAEICINILLKGVETRELPSETVSQLGKWAYELCPNEYAFQEVYRELGLRY